MAFWLISNFRQRVESEGTTTWTFYATGTSQGLLHNVTSPAVNYQESHVYNGLAQLTETTTSIDGTAYVTHFAYSGQGQLQTMTYPATVGGARPVFNYSYVNGFVATVTQGSGNTERYALVALDALGRERQATLGNALLTRQHLYDAANLRLKGIQSGPPAQPSDLQHYSYAWDKVGNLTQRMDQNQSLTEGFTYDALNRVDVVTRNGTTTLLDMVYDDDGNISNKQEQGLYTYLASRPHAVWQTNVSCGPGCCVTTSNYGYDANGNMTDRDGGTITWTSFNKPRQINLEGSNCTGDCTTFTYGPQRQPIKQVVKKGGSTTTIYYIGAHFEKQVGATIEYRSHALVNGERFYTQIENSGDWVAYYNLRDHLGSVDKQALTVGSGTDPLEYSFDAFGKRRNTNWTPDNSDALQTATLWNHRGYTDHEQLDSVRLIHLGGRVYDPKLGRFLSADPVLGDLGDPQSLNPYSYVANNPLSYTDPTGLFLSKVFKGVRRAIRSVGSFGRRVVRNYGRALVAAAAAAYTAGAVQGWVLTATDGVAVAGTGAAAMEAGSTLGLSLTATQASVVGWTAGGAVGGAIATKSAKGAFWGGVTGGAFAGVNAAFGGQYTVGRVVTEGAVGGASTAAQGGEFWQGFGLSATSASAEYAYQSIVRYGTDWGPGGEAQAKGEHTRPYARTNNVGFVTLDPAKIKYDLFSFSENSPASRLLNQLPSINAVAGMHDVFQSAFSEGLVRDIVNVPGMVIASGITYPALLHGVPSVWLADE